MEIKVGPDSVDQPSLQYKLQRKIKVFNTNNHLSNRGYNLVTSSSKYGIIFVASPSRTISAYYLRELIDKECEPKHLTVQLPIQPTHIAINCDQEWLAVTGDQMLIIYKCQDFQNQTVGPAATIKCDVSPSTYISALQWNPCIPDTIGLVYFDGSLIICQVSTMQIKKIQSNAKCLCWSPKGKQLVTGNNDGTLTQYKPDLTPMKVVPAPNLFQNAPVEALAIYWIATYQFAVTYKNATDKSRPSVTIVNTPKGGQMSCVNYDDICYSMGSNRPWYYYLQGIPQWNMILTSSSNSMEIATLASGDGVNWLQFCQSDEARPELPLTDKKIENFPVGICIDTCAVHQLPWGESETLPPMPLLLVVSQTGLLTLFNIVNLNKSSPQVCSPPQPLSLPQVALTNQIPDDAPPPPVAEPVPQQIPVQAQPVQPLAVQPQPTQPVQPQAFQPQPFQPQGVQPQPFQPQAVQPQLFQPQPVQPQPVQPQPVQPQPVQPQPVQPQPLQAQAQPQQIQANQFAQQAQPSFSSSFTAGQTQAAQPQAVLARAPQNTDTAALSVPKPTAPAVSSTSSSQAQPKLAVVQSPTAPETQAIKTEQTKINKAKINEEIKNMIVKEVNDFQMELYNFRKLANEKLNKMQNDLQSTNITFDLHELTAQRLKKDCDIDELHESVVQLKLELVRACAVVAEARTHAQAKELHEWTQEDPLTAKRIASVKKLSYYVQTQLDQARGALDHKWNQIAMKDEYSKPGERMIRPLLDDVYQPLVRQQEILSRQEAVLRTLRNTLSECDVPVFRSASILRSTPFKKDPLSKLTRNILNMSIEPPSKPKELLSSHKLDALRDMLSNHTPNKIKPVQVDLRKQLENLKKRYDKSLKEKKNAKEVQNITVKTEVPSPQSKVQPAVVPVPVKTVQAKPQIPVVASVPKVPTFVPQVPVKIEPKPDPPKESPITIPTFTPVSNVQTVKNIGSVARTLFTEEPKPEPVIPTPVFSTQPTAQATAEAPKPTPPAVSKPSLLHSVLTSDVKPFAQMKTGENTFMGQKICSPSAFSFSKPPATNTFTAKPISDLTNMFSKFTSPPPNPPEDKTSDKLKSNETGEQEGVTLKQNITVPAFRPTANIFSGMPSQTPENTEVPKISTGFVFGKAEDKTTPKDKSIEKEIVVPKINTGFVFGKSETATPREKSLEKETVKENIVEGKKEVASDGKKENESVKTIKPTDQTVIVVDLKKNTDGSANKPVASIFSAPPISNSASSAKAQPVITVTSQPKLIIGSTVISPVDSQQKTEKSAETSSVVVTPVAKSEPEPPPSQAISVAVASTITATSTTSSTATSPLALKTSTPSTQASAFVSIPQPNSSNEAKDLSTSSSPSIFAAKPSTPTSVFAATTSASSIFASASASAFGATTTQSVFGSQSPTTQSPFGQATTAPVFGSSPAQSIFSAAASNVFGSTTPTTSQSVFGTTTQASVFGSNQGSVFGATNQVSVFGSPTTQASIFGSPTTQASVFSPAQTTQASVFGTPAQGSVFGAQTTQSSSVFGSPTTSAQSGSIFGGNESNLFASASISTTSASSPSSGGNIFGGSPSVFGGSNANVFGSKASFTGTNATAANIFGGAAATSFGQKPANDFWSGGGNNNAPPGFGTPAFGQQATTQASSIFGNTSGGSFSSPSTGQPFGSPQTSFGGENKSVFGTPQQQTGAPAFGGSPVFGSNAVFGGKPSFGSPGFGGGFNNSPSSGFGASPAFGGGATFGSSAFGNASPGKVFGNSSPGAGFGSPAQQSNPVFENLATQNTLTFGNLAQQSGPAPQAQPSFNTSPSFTGWRG